jgi:hypothetical protein
VTDATPYSAWCAAFVEAQGDLVNPKATKLVKAGAKQYRFAPLPEVIDTVRQVLREHGLGFAQDVVIHGDTAQIGTRIYHRAGHEERFGPLSLSAGDGPQDAGSAITYARRYALCAALGIAADEDDDAAGVKRGVPASHSAGSAAPGEGTNPLPSEDLPPSSGGRTTKPCSHPEFEPVPGRQDVLRCTTCGAGKKAV